MDTKPVTPEEKLKNFNECVANTYADNSARTYRPTTFNFDWRNAGNSVHLGQVPVGKTKEDVRNEARAAANALIDAGKVCEVRINHHDFGQCAWDTGLPRNTCQKQR